MTTFKRWCTWPVVSMIITIIIWCLPQLVFAQDATTTTPNLFHIPKGDLSIQFLAQIFGNVADVLKLPVSEVGKTTGQTVVGDLFHTFNAAVLALGGIVVIYTIIISVLYTAHEGQVLGRRWSSLWIPVRSALGISLLIPIKGSSYSLIQIFMMWVVVQGIGAADSIWSTAIKFFKEGGAAYSVTEPDAWQYVSTAGQLYNSLVCTYSLDNYFKAGNNKKIASVKVPKREDHGVFYFPGDVNITQKGHKDRHKIYRRLIGACGSIDVSQYKKHNKYQAYTYMKAAVRQMMQDMEPAAKDTAKQDELNSQKAENAMLQASLDYKTVMLPVFNAKASDHKDNSKFFDDAKKQGWILAGAYYYNIANFTSKQQAEATFIPGANFRIGDGVKHYSTKQLKKNIEILTTEASNANKSALNKARQESGANQWAGIKLSSKVKVSGSANAILKILTGGLSNVIDAWQRLFTIEGAKKTSKGSWIFGGGREYRQRHLNPVSKIAKFGTETLKAVETSWIVGVSVLFGLGFLSGVLGCIGGAVNAVVSWIVPIVTIVMTALVVMGATLAYYVPLVPFLFFMFGGVGWLIGVIEAMVAAPLVALGVAHPEGSHDVYGKAQPAVTMLVSIFLRPSLMIIGMLAGMTLTYVALNLLNAGFAYAFNQVIDLGGNDSLTGIFPPIVIMIIYTVIVVVLLNKTFSLITTIPDKTLRWIEGGQAASMFGEEARGMVGDTGGKVKGGFETGGKAHGQAVQSSQQAAQATGGKLGEGMKESDDERKETEVKDKGKGGGGGGQQPPSSETSGETSPLPSPSSGGTGGGGSGGLGVSSGGSSGGAQAAASKGAETAVELGAIL